MLDEEKKGDKLEEMKIGSNKKCKKFWIFLKKLNSYSSIFPNIKIYFPLTHPRQLINHKKTLLRRSKERRNKREICQDAEVLHRDVSRI